MELPRPLAIAVLTCAAVASAPLVTAAPNDPATRLQEPAAAQPVAPPVASEAENLFWQSIMNSTNPAEFEAYLRRFPNGMFSELAHIRLEVLRRTPAVTRTGARSSAIPFSIEFGDDTGDWARDGECDDVRFEGDGTAAFMLADDRGRDASDCRQLYDEGLVRLFGVDLASGVVDFGDDTSDSAQDGECDDPRFEGDAMAPFLLQSDRGRDAGDCRRLYDEGRIRPFGVTPTGRL